MEDVDPQLVAALIDTSFTLDSLGILDPFIALTGQIEITEIGPTGLSGNFAGVMASTNMSMLVVNNGLFSAASAIPVLEYSSGSLHYEEDGSSTWIAGDLSPLQSMTGVGATAVQAGDTLTTRLFAYDGDLNTEFSIYGMVLKGRLTDYPTGEAVAQFPIGGDAEGLPQATPYLLKHASLEQLLTLLNSDSLPAGDSTDSLFLPADQNTVSFCYPAAGGLQADFAGLTVSNSSSQTHVITENWLLGAAAVTALTPDPGNPLVMTDRLVGRAYPNPFNSSVVLPLRLSETARVKLTLYNVRGQTVRQQDLGIQMPGAHAYHLDLGGTALPGGVYVYELATSTGQHAAGNLLYLK